MLAPRQVDTLIGLCKGIVADCSVNQLEAEFLHSWLVANEVAINHNPMIARLLDRVGLMLEDGLLDDDESRELFSTLHEFSGDAPEVGELIKTSTLPVNQPQPHVKFQDKVFLFTGTCASGTREECEAIVEKRGGVNVRGVTRRLNYLVVGYYVTESWKHETFGNKILKAMKYRDQYGVPAIVTEEHWATYVTPVRR